MVWCNLNTTVYICKNGEAKKENFKYPIKDWLSLMMDKLNNEKKKGLTDMHGLNNSNNIQGKSIFFYS